jgi:glycerophosphoryl diester phosphodiesterase
MWPTIPRPIIFAHRGASALAPENTIPAFELAAKMGAPAIEFDVKLTGDGQVVIIHDQTVDRTTDGQGDIRKLSLTEIKELDAGIRFKDAYVGTRIPTLSETMETIGQRLYMNIELTNYATPLDQLVERVVDLINHHNLGKRVLFSSFYPRNLRRAKELMPDVPCGLLTWPRWMGWWGRTIEYRKSYYVALHPNMADVGPDLIERVHAARHRIHVWTVNDEKEIQNLINWGADGFFTDDPAKALTLLGKST